MTMIVGHRGARNLWAENSLSGFRNLVGLDAEAVEFDVHATRSGEILVIHDATLDRTTSGSGLVHEIGRRGIFLNETLEETIPTLEETLDVFAGADGMELHIEIKTDASGNPYPGLEARVAEIVLAHKLEERSVLTCFAVEVLEVLKARFPDIRRLCSFDRRSAEMMGGLDAALDRVLSVADLVAVEQGLLGAAHERIGRRIPAERLGVWVPNTVADLNRWLRVPLRQITTDRPDLGLLLKNSPEGSARAG